MNSEGYGPSAHTWSSTRERGSLSRIGFIAESKRTFFVNECPWLIPKDIFFRGYYESVIRKKYKDYMRLTGCTASYELKNGITIAVPFLEENFLHLVGIHKLTDIQIVQFWNDRSNKTVKSKDVIKAIKNEKLTDAMIKASTHFPLIADRYNNFSYDSLTTLSYTDAIIDFNPTLAHSMIQSDYLLFEKKGKGYKHLGIALDKAKGMRYVETFFYENSNQYVQGQIIEPIIKFTIYDKANNPIISDTF